MSHTKKLIFSIVLLIVGVSFCVIFAKQQTNLATTTKKYLTAIDERDSYKAKSEMLEDEARYLIDDRAKSLPGYDEIYSFQTFGIMSPLLEGKKVSVVPFLYKRHQILAKTVILAEEEQSSGAIVSYGITVWQFGKSTYGADITQFAIFDGYENKGSPKQLSEILNLKGSTKTKTSQGLYFETPDLYVKAINFEGISMYTYEQNTVLMSPVFIRVWAGNVQLNPDGNWKSEANVYKNHLKEIADTISIR